MVTLSLVLSGPAAILECVRIQRPGPLWWIWYAFGGKLPDRYRDWVLHDVTCRTWWLRHVLAEKERYNATYRSGLG